MTNNLSPIFNLRPLRAGDLDRIARLEQDLFGPSAWSYAMISAELGAPGRWYVVAEYDSKTQAGGDLVVGYAGLWFDGDVAQIMTVGVALDARRRGVGRLLMTALIERAEQLGAHGLLLEVAVTNEPAIAMYQEFGFETVRVRKRYYQPEDLDAFVMRREIAAPAAHPAHAAPSISAQAHAQGTGITARDRVFITADQLAAELGSDHAPTVLDVRWALGQTDGREQYGAGHIPGAIYVDLETDLAAPAGDLGRHPLPNLDTLAAAIGRWGITKTTPVVVYDAVAGMSAARAWWLLRWVGFENVRILDGALAAWTGAGHLLESLSSGSEHGSNATGALDQSDQGQPAEHSAQLSTGHMPTLTIDQAGAFPEEAALIDARAHERFTGAIEPIDPRAGHIPGALNIPTASLVNADGTFKSVPELTEMYAEAGVLEETEMTDEGGWPVPVQEVAVYCGSGVTAAHQIAVLASLGIEAALFPGSWSQWSQDPDRPVSTGE